MPCCAVPHCREGYPDTVKENKKNGTKNPSFFIPSSEVVSSVAVRCIAIDFQ